MNRDPRVTVLLAVRNGEKYLREAIASVLGQTFRDFEFLIVDDASSDGTVSIIESYTDPRIRLVRNPAHSGLAGSLNRGLDLARGVYVARMDHDDISLPRRLEEQVAFLDGHLDVGACGTWVEVMGEKTGKVWRYPVEPGAVRCRLLFESPLAHPTVMFRKESLSKAGLRYDPAFRRAQDYDLWVRSVPHFSITNLARVLMRYRVHPEQAGSRDFEEQQEYAGRVRRAQLEGLGIDPTPEEFSVHQALGTGRIRDSREFVERAGSWLWKIRKANDDRGIYPEPYFSRYLGERWFSLCKRATRWGTWTWHRYRESPLGTWRVAGLGRMIGFAWNCGTRRGR